jgi:hypothetical protein
MRVSLVSHEPIVWHPQGAHDLHMIIFKEAAGDSKWFLGERRTKWKTNPSENQMEDESIGEQKRRERETTK